jgi:HAD superfamily hydrolase (TIGR01509 family)
LCFEIWAECIGRPYGYFDPYAYLEQLNGASIDRNYIRVQRHARLTELNSRQPLQPGVLAYLHDAQRLSLKIGLASSSDRVWVHGHLERLALLHYFTVTKCVEDTGTHKPDPGPYLAVLETLNLLPSEAVAFEDSPNGIASAEAAGIYCVAVPNPITRQLRLEHADYRLESLASLPLSELLQYVTGTRVSR